jgi:thioredoxin reductase
VIDAAIIGGSFAGPTAALQLAHASRSVMIVDAGAPRNRTSPGAHGIAVTLSDGFVERHAALFFGPQTSLTGSPAQRLGVKLPDGPMGPFVRDGSMAQTSIDGVSAADVIARPMPNINFALANGAQAGTACYASLLFPGFVQPIEESPTQ